MCRRVLGPLVVVAALLGLIAAVDVPPAASANPHRAAVIVDTGTSVHRIVITFTEDSITGIAALQRAAASPVVYTFTGQGGAVCRLFGVGRDAGPGCLGGQDGDNRYWAYFRAPAGTTRFTYSSVGAGSSRVHDGDVEGWRFGTGAAPEYVSLQTLAPPPPPPTTPTTRSTAGRTSPSPPGGSAPGSPANAATGPQASASPSTASTLPITGAAGSAAGASGGAPGAIGSGAPTTTSTRAKTADDGRASKRSESRETALASSSEDGGSSAWSLVWFGALLALIVIAILVARRVRRRAV